MVTVNKLPEACNEENRPVRCLKYLKTRFSSTREVSAILKRKLVISLNTEKIIIFPIFFCKSGVLTRLCGNLAIRDKITRFAAFFSGR